MSSQRPHSSDAQCSVCGSRMAPETNFCGVCGARLYAHDQLGPRSAATDTRIIGRIVANRYKVLKMIGQGGMGTVYLVEHIYIGKLMAMKVLHAKFLIYDEVVRRFKREAEAVSKLSSIHTVSVFDFGRFDDMFYIVMEYLKGVDVATVLEKHGALPSPRVVRTVLQVCDSVAEAHEMHIIHRDLKPENLFFITLKDGRDFVKVLDFGLAKIIAQHEEHEQGATLSGAGRLVGTPYYMSPEQIRNREIDARSDIYSLGAVMYTMLAGCTVFEGESAMEVVSKHLTQKVVPLSSMALPFEIPQELDEIVLKALEKEPTDRFQTIDELAQRLHSLIQREGGNPTAMSHLRLQPVKEGETLRKMSAPTVITDPLPVAAEKVHTEEATRPTVEMAAASADLDLSASGADLNQSVGEWQFQFAKGESAGEWHDALESIELERITTREEFDKFEVKLKRRRVSVALLPLLVVAAVAFLFVWGYWMGNLLPKGVEREPNNQPSTSNALTLGQPMKGYLGKRLSAREGDRDFYRFTNPHKEAYLTIAITAIPNMDVAFEISCTEDNRFLPMNFNGRGEPELIRYIYANRRDCFVMVREQAPLAGSPIENESDPYRLTVTAEPLTPGFEEEPNQNRELATNLLLDKPLRGELSGRNDLDVFHVDAQLGVTEGILVRVKGDLGTMPSLVIADRSGSRISAVPLRESANSFILAGYKLKPGLPLWVHLSGQTAQVSGRPYQITVSKIEMSEREPNNNQVTATPIYLGGRYTGSLETREAVDVYRLDAKFDALSAIAIELLGGSNDIDLALRITDAAGKVLATINDHSPGKGEIRPALRFAKPQTQLFLTVYNAKPQAKRRKRKLPPTEYAPIPYTLRVGKPLKPERDN